MTGSPYEELREQLNDACKHAGVDVEFDGFEVPSQFAYKLETVLLFLLRREAEREEKL